MCITYSVWSSKSATNFSFFSIFRLWGKNGKSLWSLRNFSRYFTSTWRKYPSSLSSLYFFMKSLLNWEVSLFHSKLLTLWHCPPIYIIYIPILDIRGFFIFIIIFHLVVFSFCIWTNRVTYSSCYTFFYH